MLRLLLSIVCFLAVSTAGCQQCPQEDPKGPDLRSASQTLSGHLVYHSGVRQWFELKLDKPQCAQESIQLVLDGDDWAPIETLRACDVQSNGELGDSGTGYFSLAVYQNVKSIEPVGTCIRQKPLPDYSKLKPAPWVKHYEVHMLVNYRPGDHPIRFKVTSRGKPLSPWQAYASYQLTGGYVLYGLCGKGFEVKDVSGTPEAKPNLIDMATFDPETAAAAGKWNLDLAYTCTRGSSGDDAR